MKCVGGNLLRRMHSRDTGLLIYRILQLFPYLSILKMDLHAPFWILENMKLWGASQSSFPHQDEFKKDQMSQILPKWE